MLMSQLTISARKPHKATHRHRAHAAHVLARSHKKHRAHKIKDNRPELTLNDVKDSVNIWGIDVSHHQADIDWPVACQRKASFHVYQSIRGS